MITASLRSGLTSGCHAFCRVGVGAERQKPRQLSEVRECAGTIEEINAIIHEDKRNHFRYGELFMKSKKGKMLLISILAVVLFLLIFWANRFGWFVD